MIYTSNFSEENSPCVANSCEIRHPSSSSHRPDDQQLRRHRRCRNRPRQLGKHGFTVFLGARNPAGNIYLGDQNNNVVRKVDPSERHAPPSRDFGAQGFSGDSGPATQALLNGPLGCVAPPGDLSERQRERLDARYVELGTITTVAGSASTLSFGDGGPATSAGLTIPIRCAVDQSGNLPSSIKALIPSGK